MEIGGSVSPPLDGMVLLPHAPGSGILAGNSSRVLALCGDKLWRHPWISHKAADCGTRPQRLLSLFLRCLSLPNYVSSAFPLMLIALARCWKTSLRRTSLRRTRLHAQPVPSQV